MRTFCAFRAGLAILAVVAALTNGIAHAHAAEASSSDETLEQQLRFRNELHFEADPQYVRDINERPQAYNARREYGAWFTPNELRELADRVKLSRSLEDVRIFAEREAPAEFSDIYIDHAAGGVARVGFTDNAQAYEERIRRFFPYPDRLATFTSDWSLNDLRSTQQALMDDAGKLREAGVPLVALDIDVRGNRAVAWLFPYDPADAERLRAEYGLRLEVRQGIQGDTEEALDGARNNVWSPLRGGLQLRMLVNGSYQRTCTSGHMLYDDTSSGRQYFMSTAGHCFSPNDPSRDVYQGRYSDGTYRRINPMTRYNYEFTSDSGAVHIPSGLRSPYLYVHPHDYAHVVSQWQRVTQDGVGDIVCPSGVYNPGTTTQQTCGTVLSRNYVTSVANSCACFRTATYPHQGGDSGNAIYSAHVANGIHRGADPDGNAVYSHIGYVLTDLGMNGVMYPGG